MQDARVELVHRTQASSRRARAEMPRPSARRPRRSSPVRDRDADGRAPVPGRAAHPRFAALLDRREHRRLVVASSPNAEEDLVQDDLVEDLATRDARALRRTPARGRSSGRRGSATPARPSERSAAYTANAARAPRELRRPVHRVAVAFSSTTRYSATRRIAARCASGSATNASPQSYGTLSHLCASVAHESARSTPRRAAAATVTSRPEAERPVEVEPGAGPRRGRRSRGADRPRRRSPRRPARRRSPGLHRRDRLGERVRPHPSLLVLGRLVARAVAEPEQRAMCRSVTWRFRRGRRRSAARRRARHARRPSRLARGPRVVLLRGRSREPAGSP